MTKPQKPFIFVTLQGPDDGGDFGPGTPGTKTGGIQEAIDHAHNICRDVYIWGGRGGLHEGKGLPDNIYRLEETLRIPWSQDFRLDGGNYLLHHTGNSGPAVQIDSQMNCRYKFGLIASDAPGPVVCIKPESSGPDDFTVITASIFDFSCVVSHHPGGVSIQLDSSEGPIINSSFFAEETNATGTGVYLSDNGGQGHAISNNNIRVMYGNQYHSRGDCTGLRLGDPGTDKIRHNTLEMSFHAPRGAYFDHEKKAYATIEDYIGEQAVGTTIHAQRNVMNLSFFGSREPGMDIVFEEDARDNTIMALNLPNGVTDRANVPTNKITTNWPVGFAVETPVIPASGEPIVNRSSFSVQVLILEPGTVLSWSMFDPGSTPQLNPYNLSLVDNLKGALNPVGPDQKKTEVRIEGGLHSGQTFTLDPGDAISFDYSAPPKWRWKATR